MSVQEHLEIPYHGYHYLCERFLTGMDTPSIQASFKDRNPSNSQQQINLVGNILSYKPIAAGAVMENYAYDDDHLETSDEGIYTICKRYGG